MDFLKISRYDALIWIGIWLLILLIIDPVGNYPINDDWAYAQIVKRFVETGIFDLGFWPGMTLFTHIIWGSLFCKLFGFSFTVLRIANLCLAIVGSLVFLSLILNVEKNVWRQRFAVAVLLFNPFFLLLSFSYMTDVTFLTLLLLGLYFFKLAFEKDRYRDWGLALIFSVAAILTRQLALILPIAFGVVTILKYRNIKHSIIAFTLVGVSFLSLYGYTSYMEATVGLPPPFGRPESLMGKLNFGFIFNQINDRGGVHLFYWSIFLVPLIAISDISFKRTKRDIVLLAGVVLISIYFFIHSWNLIPIGNLIYGKSFGPHTLVDIQKGFSPAEHLSRSSWSVIIGIGLLASVLFLYSAGKKVLSISEKWKRFTDLQMWKLGVLLMFFSYSLFILIDHHKFDRYFFPVYALLMLLIASRNKEATPKKGQKIIGIVTLFIIAIYSLIATKDYHSWQQARWEALDELVSEKNISPFLIDGGFEFNGWYETGPSNPGGKNSKSWWFVHEDEYAIARYPYECYEVVNKFPTNTWLDPLGDSLSVLKKPALSRKDTLFTDLETLSENGEKAISENGAFTFILGGEIDTTVAFSGRQSVLLTPEHPYGVSIDLDSVQQCEQITITSWRRGNPGSAGTVIRAPDVNLLHSYERFFIDERGDDGWVKLRHELSVPHYYNNDTLHVYFWNPVPESVWVDNIRIIRRRTLK